VILPVSEANAAGPTVQITGVPVFTDGKTPFTVTYTFSAYVRYFNLDDALEEMNDALTNATASDFVAKDWIWLECDYSSP
jgi:hypothetical protein